MALRLVATGHALTTTDLARACAISHEHARRELVALSRVGVLRRVGTGRRTSYILA
jgi:DeoR/GlpR family transcriptional regulator of sugar metabolism